MGLTPDEAISIAFRAASRGMAQGITPRKASAFEVFLVQVNDSTKQTAKAITMVAKYRPDATTKGQIAMLENHAFNQTLQTAINSLMLLGHFPYLDGLDAAAVKDKLDD